MNKFLGKIGTGLSIMAIAASNLPVQIAQAQVTFGDLQPDNIRVANDPSRLLTNIINLVFVVAAALTFFYLVYGAIQWITSGGDKSKVEEARNRITAAVIGLLILAATWAVFMLIMQIAFGADPGGIRIDSFVD